MAWSLNYQEIKEPDLLDQFFLALGKALFLACAYESKCRSILGLLHLVQHYESTGDASASLKLFQGIKNGPLARTIKELGTSPIVFPDQLAILERAKDSRNIIAHEVADIGDLSVVSAKRITDRIMSLRQQVKVLVEGDNLVSKWIYEIEERETAPKSIQENYPKWIEEWIFGDFGRG